jgi:hypothetical protein
MQLSGLGDRWEASIRATHNRGMETFVPPTRGQGMQLEQLVRELRDVAEGHGDLEAAREDAAALDLQLVELDRHLLLQDQSPRGWGTALFRRGESRGLVVEVPHPGSDYRTPELGLRFFEESGADVYLLSGANRYNRADPSLEQPNRRLSDAAHSAATFFHAAHCGLVEPRDRVLQVHGFGSQEGDPTVVISDGQDDGHDPPALIALAARLEQAEVPNLIADFESPLGKRLGGKTNLQAQNRNATFLHMEVSEAARRELDPKLVRAVAEWAGEESSSCSANQG